MADNVYTTFLKDPDQAARRAELVAFIGPNPAGFLALYDRLAAGANRQPGEKIKFSLAGNGFCAPAFFVGPVWFFYRKLWIWGAGIVAFMCLIAWLPITTRLGLPLSVALAISARQAYLYHAIKTISTLRSGDAASSAGLLSSSEFLHTSASQPLSPFLDKLRTAGGVSKTAGWIAGTLYALLVAFALFGLGYAVKTGTPLPN